MAPDKARLAGKTALVTGSSRGIGAAIARLFALQGARTVLHGRDHAALRELETTIRRAGGEVISVVAELTKLPEVEAMRERIEAAFGGVDILVANAGGSYHPPAPLEEISEEGWHATVEGNLTATFLTLKSFLPGMKMRKGGVIITISSAAGRRPHPRSPLAYAAVKAGIQLLTQDVAAEAGPFGIRANCIAPEAILTERNKQHIPPETQESMRAIHPVRRLGTPEDVASAALFLASEDASWITGQILDVAGGAVMA